MTSFDHSWPGMRLALLAGTLAGAAFAAPALAQEASMESRLRDQLRAVTGQLQQAQNELAQIKAGAAPAAAAKPVAAPAETEALRAELAQSQAQLARERDARGRRDAQFATAQQQSQQALERLEKAGAQVAQFRAAYAELLKMARDAESERHRLTKAAALSQAAIEQCTAKNQQLHAVGMEVISAYEKLDMGSVLSARQPFAAQSRVKLERIAQQFGDRLYESKFDVRAVQAPQVAESPDALQIAPKATP